MSNFFNIYINERDNNIISHCNYCGFVLQTQEDTITACKHGSCKDCYVGFVELNKNLYGNSWNPSDSDIKEWVSKLKKIYKPIYRF